MNSGGQFGHRGGRVRQYISFFLLAMFLGLFVRAMADTPVAQACGGQMALVTLAFGKPVKYELGQQDNTVTLTFPGLNKMHVEKECLRSIDVGDDGVLKRVHVRAEQSGAQVVCQLADDDLLVEVVDSMGPDKANQVLVVVSKKHDCYGRRHDKPVVFASASLYTV